MYYRWVYKISKNILRFRIEELSGSKASWNEIEILKIDRSHESIVLIIFASLND